MQDHSNSRNNTARLQGRLARRLNNLAVAERNVDALENRISLNDRVYDQVNRITPALAATVTVIAAALGGWLGTDAYLRLGIPGDAFSYVVHFVGAIAFAILFGLGGLIGGLELGRFILDYLDERFSNHQDDLAAARERVACDQRSVKSTRRQLLEI